MRIYLSVSLFLISLLTACSPKATPLSMLTPTTEEAQSAVTVTSSPSPTTTITPTLTPIPTRTETPLPTETPTPTSTSTPTPPPSPSPSPTVADTPTPPPPAPPPSPTPTPPPNLDFRLISWRLWPNELNGCGNDGSGNHVIFIKVIDANGAPLDGVVVGDTWNNVEDVTGRKGPGLTEIPLYANAMEITAKRDATSGQAYTSQASPPCGSYLTDIPNEQLAQAGYCANIDHCQWMRENDPWYCGGHYSWEVIFQRTY